MSARSSFRPLGALRTVEGFRAHLHDLGIHLGVDATLETGADAPLGRPYTLRDGFRIGNRFCIHPMEGWDGTEKGRPSDLTRRRWVRMGDSGAKLIWGGEAVAVRADGRANPHQLLLTADTAGALASLRGELVAAHERRFDRSDDLLVGLQLTHSGRFARPERWDAAWPTIAHHHPILDRRIAGTAEDAVVSDDELRELCGDYVEAAVLAQQAGFSFVDIKHCHGYLGHELLAAHTRAGAFGGTLENRTRFLRTIVEGIRHRAPGLRIGVRLSAFDTVPFQRGPDGLGLAEETTLPYRHGFGVDPARPTEPDLREPAALLAMLDRLDIELLNITGGSPYYNPHLQRPAQYPPSDGYGPPTDPLHEVARHIRTTAALKRSAPRLFVVGSGWSYLQEWLPFVAQHVVRTGQADAVGLGRLALSYPDLPADVLAGRPLDRHKICRTFSDCTTGPRNGTVSGCFPLDGFYKSRPESARIRALRPR